MLIKGPAILTVTTETIIAALEEYMNASLSETAYVRVNGFGTRQDGNVEIYMQPLADATVQPISAPQPCAKPNEVEAPDLPGWAEPIPEPILQALEDDKPTLPAPHKSAPWAKPRKDDF